MFGVGKVTQEALAHLNVRTFGDLRRIPVDVLEQRFGKRGRKMHQLCMGIDEREVIPDHGVKSIGHEETFLRDILDMDTAKKALLSLAHRVARRIRREQMAGGTVTLKVKYSNFVQITRSTTLSNFTDDGPEIYAAVCHLLKKTAVGKRPVRLLGVALSKLTVLGTETPLGLSLQDREAQKRSKLHAAVDSLHKKFGEKSVQPGTLLTK